MWFEHDLLDECHSGLAGIIIQLLIIHHWQYKDKRHRKVSNLINSIESGVFEPEKNSSRCYLCWMNLTLDSIGKIKAPQIFASHSSYHREPNGRLSITEGLVVSCWSLILFSLLWLSYLISGLNLQLAQKSSMVLAWKKRNCFESREKLFGRVFN